jgi:hypothetical protein
MEPIRSFQTVSMRSSENEPSRHLGSLKEPGLLDPGSWLLVPIKNVSREFHNTRTLGRCN